MIKINSYSIVNMGEKFFWVFILGITFLISPIVSLILSLILMIICRKESIIFSLFGGFSLAYPALFYSPLITDDASRIFHVVEAMRGVQLSYLLSWLKLWAVDYLNYPLFTMLMYIISQTLQTIFLSFIVAGLTYATIMYCVSKFTRSFEVSSFVKMLTIIAATLWINVLELISGMRFTLACALVVLIILQLFVFKRKKQISFLNWFWFFIPIAIHPGVILTILPVIIFWLFKFKHSVVTKFIFFMLFGLLSILLIGGQVLRNSYLNMLLNRLTNYQSVSYGYVLEPQKIVHAILGACITIIAVIFLHRIKKVSKMEFNKFETLNLIIWSYLVCYLVLVFSINLEMRMMMVMPIISILGICSLSSKNTIDVFTRKTEYFVLMSLLLIIISGAVYNVGVLKINFDTINWFFPLVNYQ